MVALANRLPAGGAEWRLRTRVLKVAFDPNQITYLDQDNKPKTSHPLEPFWQEISTEYPKVPTWCDNCREPVYIDVAAVLTALERGKKSIDAATSIE
jgi:hypothetical protein